MTGPSSPESVSTKLQWIAELARRTPKMVLTTLAHHIDVEWLREAYRRTRKDGAPGVDGQRAEQYEQNLEGNLEQLLNRLKAGSYKAPAVRRVYIPKGDGKTRPLGIPTLEDKVLQRSVVMVLEAVYEQDFLDCSYGFRPGRSAHQALYALRNRMMEMNGGWVLELDFRSYFDTLSHSHLRSTLDQRVRDGVLRRVIDKWLKAGVLEDGHITRPETGTPQGGVISPMLANIYLHEVLDTWFEQQVRPRLRGKAFLARYADDAVMVFSNEHDARRVMDVLARRVAKYGLTLHPDKTRIVRFERPKPRSDGQGTKPGTFDFLGFTHHWAKSKNGYWVIKQKTANGRFWRACRRMYEWCREHRHAPVEKQHAVLRQKLRGHYGYYGIPGNSRAISRFLYRVQATWRRWLDRRSQRRHMPWRRFFRLLERYPLPVARCTPWSIRVAANP